MKKFFHLPLKSSVEGIIWPPMSNPRAAAHLAMQYQLEHTQRLTTEEIQQHQLQQLNLLWHYACRQVPYYRQRLPLLPFSEREPLTWDHWQRIPLLTRDNIQMEQDSLLSRNVPPKHGKPFKTQTSGSTAKPLTVWHSSLTTFFWRAFTLREHFWHQRDFSGKLAAIRFINNKNARAPHGLQLGGWGTSTDIVLKTGPACFLDIKTPLEEQASWLDREQPQFLLSYPTNILALAHHFKNSGKALSNLQEVRTFGETVTDETRTLCQEVWGVELTDMYSTREVGYIALQCPEERQYHVQAENVLVEILRDDGTSCSPGEVGKVVITPLHNFASPLIRYDIGDYAVLGEPCPCGRGLPVINKIMGRVRNMLTLPTGQRFWPSFNYKGLTKVVAYRQIQICQHTASELEIRLVVDGQISTDQEKEMTAIIHKALNYPFAIAFTYADTIPRTKGGKYEEFISHVA
ncbi:MAG: phenylacetate--CoA ligase family protein [Deltaproteobacteria bacterium]|nr:phenylacetate--CoA ligase family protein [Candidatus Anaeroferrophillus wilburensis]MBN2887901.1 phenylacetate--CoA ligase family protein [Deltaproteobacteria bacterium]